MANTESLPDHFRLILDQGLSLTIEASGPLVLTLIIFVILAIGLRLILSVWGPWRSFEIDEAEFGLGDQKVKIRPNEIDRQIAYKIWVELSTRKVGLEIDLDNDVISEIYDSWYSFFSVTRELIKDVPVSKFRRKDTERIISLSIDVLNSGIRPHLTKWQARFRRWYDFQLAKDENADLHPQDIQKKFPDHEELKKDIMAVNKNLIGYRKKMHQLVSGI
ncbi:hypothetical protein [Aquisalimonas asiatica]|uniref:Uncharacterized protein n=1 Tax=Aquisalimonas asiatica TaxID=406100 RepID=A0A1H8UXH7_9GAMM|nr:hypothetical protein [Aquisalimonas asiatica]SEP07654.1 hypothetical protein SAMN04488052_108121 [Aquisalimonas asiatica]